MEVRSSKDLGKKSKKVLRDTLCKSLSIIKEELMGSGE